LDHQDSLPIYSDRTHTNFGPTGEVRGDFFRGIVGTTRSAGFGHGKLSA
jgi:hypothetical protein